MRTKWDIFGSGDAWLVGLRYVLETMGTKNAGAGGKWCKKLLIGSVSLERGHQKYDINL